MSYNKDDGCMYLKVVKIAKKLTNFNEIVALVFATFFSKKNFGQTLDFEINADKSICHQNVQ